MVLWLVPQVLLWVFWWRLECLNPNAELMMLFLPIPIKAKYFIPGIIALDLFSAFTGVSIFSPSNTAYIAHIGGADHRLFIDVFLEKKSI